MAFIEDVKRNSLITFSEDELIKETPVLKNFDTALFDEQPIRSSFRHSPNQLNAEHFQPGISRNHFLTEPIVSAAGNDPAVVRISTGGGVQSARVPLDVCDDVAVVLGPEVVDVEAEGGAPRRGEPVNSGS